MTLTLSEIHDNLNTMEASDLAFDVRDELLSLTRIVSDMHADLGDLARRVERLAKPALLEALRLYIKLDNDRRSGCQITAEDWAECYQTASIAIAKATGQTTSQGEQ